MMQLQKGKFVIVPMALWENESFTGQKHRSPPAMSLTVLYTY